MSNSVRSSVVLSVVLCMLSARSGALGSTPGEIFRAFADRLVNEQLRSGEFRGAWLGETTYTGYIVAGLASVYQATCIEDHRAVAEAGGEFFLSLAEGNYCGDEAMTIGIWNWLEMTNNPREGEVVAGVGRAQLYLRPPVSLSTDPFGAKLLISPRAFGNRLAVSVDADAADTHLVTGQGSKALVLGTRKRNVYGYNLSVRPPVSEWRTGPDIHGEHLQNLRNMGSLRSRVLSLLRQ